MIDIADWEYLTEGGHHIILRRKGAEQRYKGFILRVEKIMPALHEFKNEPTNERTYTSNVMELFLSTMYAIRPCAVNINSLFVDLLNKILQEDLNRVRKELVSERCRVAYLFPDVTDISSFLPRPMLYTCSSESLLEEGSTCGTQISVEIKVKNGFKSTSPFASHRIKHRCSRYLLNQYAKQFKSQYNNCGMKYGGTFPGISLYDPADICSRDESRVLHALQCLFENPQNNLKISSDGEHIYGLNLLDAEKLSYKCSQLFSGRKGSPSATYSNCVDPCGPPTSTLEMMMVKILCAESALQRLRYVQSLDILDVEGIQKVFDVFCRSVAHDASLAREGGDERSSDVTLSLNLVARSLEIFEQHNVCDDHGRTCSSCPVEGSRDGREASAEPPSGVAPSCVQGDLLCQLNGHSGSVSHVDDGNVTGIDCECVLHKLRHYMVNEECTEEEVHAIRGLCSDEIDSLSACECLLVLKLWLMSLAASDASIVVTIKECKKPMSESTEFDQHCSSTADGGVITMCSPQSSNRVGCMSVTHPSVRSTSYFAYKVSFVDLGPKPVGKILSKMRQEEELCSQAASIYEELLSRTATQQ